MKKYVVTSDVSAEIRLYAFIILVIFLSLVVTTPELSLLLAGSALLVFLVSFSSTLVRAPQIIINLLIFQNFILGVSAHLLSYSKENLSYVTQIPFLLLAIMAVLSFLREKVPDGIVCLRLEDGAFLVLCILLLTEVMTSSGSIEAKLVGVRNYTTFYLAFLVGEYYLKEQRLLEQFARFLIRSCVMLTVVGGLLYPMELEFWEKIGIREVYIAKHNRIVTDILPDRFYTDFLGHMVKRMGALYYEPVNLAYLLACGFLVASLFPWTRNLVKRLVTSTVIGIGLLLTFGKGGMLIVGLSLGCYLTMHFYEMIGHGERRRFKNAFFVILVTVIFIAGKWYVNRYDAITNPHFVGIINTWKAVVHKPLGYGLGNGGNAGLMFGAMSGESYWDLYENWLSAGGETALMAFMYQMGIVAFIPFFLCFHGMTTRVIKSAKLDSFGRMVAFWPYILLGVSIYQENTFTPQCITSFMLMVGGYAGRTQIEENE